MTRYLLDTGIASDYINRQFGVFERTRKEMADGHQIGIATPVLAELVAGIEKSQTRDRNMKRLLAKLGTSQTLAVRSRGRISLR